ncbi:glycosyltransferase family 2 protein [Novosphingobium lentum]|uniref:glycosyltransferase family 2 protein n=1 Tax=Novosphingobium lentum TaxID=145287 RepID=UPI00082BFE3B|nr:glycosyltransferase family A protein [Novosphingobium lentum]
MPLPEVSVICIFLDGERFIAEAIDSVLRQQDVAFELLLVDDGSTDGSTAIAQGYAERFPDKVRYLEHPGHVNRGMSATRNLGIRAAQADAIAFIDCDDVWRPRKLAEQQAILTQYPAVGMVCGTVNYWSSWEGGSDRLIPTGPVLDAVSPPPATSLALYPLGTASAPCPSDVLVRKSVIGAVGGFEEQYTGARHMYEDQPFFGKVYLATGVYFSSQVWLDYRIHDESCVASVRRDGRYGEVRRFFLDWFAAYLASHDIADKAVVERAIRRAQWKLDHPLVARIARKLGSIISRA